MRLGLRFVSKAASRYDMQGTGLGLEQTAVFLSKLGAQSRPGDEVGARGRCKLRGTGSSWSLTKSPSGLFWILDSGFYSVAASLFLALGIPLCPTFARVGTWQAAQPYRYPSRQAAKPLSEGAVRAQQKKGAAAQGTRKRKTAQRCVVGDSIQP